MPTGSTNIPGFKEEQPPSQPHQQMPVVNPGNVVRPPCNEYPWTAV